jgi:glycerol-3-phosphate dehydrogenase
MNRAVNLRRMSTEAFDLLVIGGGITGAGVALDAVSRGLSVALVERNDFSEGTSSRSSKLIHGGLRYLKQLQFKVTFEASREKALLQRLAPHLVEELEFVLPVYGGPVASAMLSAGLWMYDAAAGLHHIHRHYGKAEARRRYPQFRNLHGAYVYHDARADDCRLVIHVIKKAADLGAAVANYAEIVLVAKGRAAVRDCFGGEFEVRAKSIVNATGVWCDQVRRLEEPQSAPLVRPSKGVHLVVSSERLGLRGAAILPSARDGRVIFIIPWGDHSVIGTTDTFYDGDLDRPRAEHDDVDYLLALANEHLPEARLTHDDVISTYAGLRPLLVDGSEVASKASREHLVVRSKGMITVTGGKLTTFRRMAKEVVDLLTRRRCRTHRIDLFAAPPDGSHLVRAYGSEAGSIGERSRIVDGLPYVWGEVEQAVRREMAMTAADVLERRTRIALFAKDGGAAVAEAVGKRVSAAFGAAFP